VDLGSSALRCAIVAASFLAPRPAHAECFILTAPFVMRESVFELVFSGTVVEVARTGELAYRATFDVDRVWKGSVARRIDLYVWELSAEHPRFEAGHHYVALAQKLTDSRTRQGVGLAQSDTVAFTPVQCSGSLDPDIARDLGTGLPPK
jgi:hypothetical protein